MTFNIFKAMLLSGMALSCSLSMLAQVDSTQTEKETLSNNAVYASVSPSIIYLGVSVFYERIVYKKEKMAYFARAGYGAYVLLLEGSGDFFLLQGGLITGAQKHHFEATLGATYFSKFDDSGDRVFLPAASVGYRRQKPGGHSVFRTGLGSPEFFYIGWGYSF